MIGMERMMKRLFLTISVMLLLAIEAVAGTYNTQANNFMFASTRLRINTINVTVPAGSEYFASQVFIGTPDFQINDLTCGFMGTWIQPNTTTPEQPQGGSILLDGATLLVNGVRYRFQPYATSSTNWNVESGGYFWMTVHTPKPIRFVDSALIIATGFVAPGTNRAGGARIKPYLNEGVLYSSSSLASYLDNGTIGNSIGPAGTLQYAVAPVTCVATGWDGRPVYLTWGDSINYGNTEYINGGGPSGELGWLDRGLSSRAYNARRYPYWNTGVATSKMSDITNASSIALRMAFLAPIPNFPATKIFVQGGTNNGTNTTAAWQASMSAGWTTLVQWGVPIIQSTMPAKSTVTDQSGYSTVAGQGWATNPWWTPTTGAGDTVNAWILGLPSGINQAIDVRPAFSGTLVGGSPNTFREDIFSIVGTVSTTSVTAGQSFIKSSVPLNINTAIAVGVGTANVEQVVISSDPSTTTCPCQSSTFSSFVNNHSIGETIVEVPTPDGTHANSTMYQRVGDEAIGFMKKSGVLNFLLRRDVAPATNDNDPMWLEKVA